MTAALELPLALGTEVPTAIIQYFQALLLLLPAVAVAQTSIEMATPVVLAVAAEQTPRLPAQVAQEQRTKVELVAMEAQFLEVVLRLELVAVVVLMT